MCMYVEEHFEMALLVAVKLLLQEILKHFGFEHAMFVGLSIGISKEMSVHVFALEV